MYLSPHSLTQTHLYLLYIPRPRVISNVLTVLAAAGTIASKHARSDITQRIGTDQQTLCLVGALACVGVDKALLGGRYASADTVWARSQDRFSPLTLQAAPVRALVACLVWLVGWLVGTSQYCRHVYIII